MVIRRPFPGLTADACGASRSATARTTGSAFPASYFTRRRRARSTTDGYVWFAGRADEIIKIAAHRLGTIEVETRVPAPSGGGRGGRRPAGPTSCAARSSRRSSCSRQGHEPSDGAAAASCCDTVRHELGAVAVIGDLNFVDMLPKTRSGKIMRRVLKAVIQDRDPGDITTIEDEGSVEEARAGRRGAAGVDARREGDRAALDAARVGQ